MQNKPKKACEKRAFFIHPQCEIIRENFADALATAADVMRR